MTNRWVHFAVISCVASAMFCDCCSAQAPAPASPPDPASAPAPAPARVEGLGLQLPANVKPRPGHGATLLVETSPGKSTVVRLHCAVGPYSFVMRPEGNISLVESLKTQPTNQPFVPATPQAMVESLKAAGFGEFKIVEASPYVFAYDCSEGFFAHTRSILESLRPGVIASLESWGLDVAEPELPLVVVIFPDRESFDKHRKVSPDIIAYYTALSNFIVMYEDQDLWEWAPEFAAKQAAYTVAHEGVHQILHNTGIQRRLSNWPAWVSEGLPEYYCPLRVNSNLIKIKNGDLPARTIKWTKPGMVHDLRMYSLLKIDARSGDVLKKIVQADDLDVDGYVLAWGLVHYLATEQPEKFRAYLKEVGKFEPLDPEHDSLGGKPDPLFVKYFGDDFAAIELALQQHLTSKQIQAEYVDPIANQTHYVVRSVEKKGKTYAVQLVITTSPGAARKWKETEEAKNDKAKFFTKICKSRKEAEFELAKLQKQ